MQAAVISEYGDPDVIVMREAPIPEPGRGEVLVRMAATTFNASDTALRAGMLRDVLPLSPPFVPGWDIAGSIVALGAGVQGRVVGELVVGRVDAAGGAAEYAAVPAESLVPAPRKVPLAHAAAIPVAGLTAWQAVYEYAHIESGQRVLIVGAGGSVGIFAVQLAARVGAHVIATASSRSAAEVLAAGAEEVVDYTAGPLPGDVDVVLNLAPVSSDTAEWMAGLARTGVAVVSIATPVPAPEAVHFTARNDPRQLAELVALVDAGELSVAITESQPLTELSAVHRRSEAGGTRGNILLVP
ncbi:MAG: NADP-dependent oxidoreductase [Nocardia sp.]|nr:NADP-dependent oxidoreductase [Nocardia sp.]NUS92484.1 NADP-dependent oxidoreductase [Nocardia sp.]